jgi:signal transduction histidine kinase/CheY-like chemotaxis protein
MKLSTRYFMAFAGFAATGFVAFALIEAVPTYREQVAQVSRLQQAAAEVAAARIESYLGSIEMPVREVAELPWQSGVLSERDHREEFHRLMKMTPAIFELRSIARDGTERLYVSRGPLDRIGSGQDLSSNEAFRRARVSAVSYGPAYFRDGTEPYVSLAVGKAGAQTDIVVAEVNLRFVAELVNGFKVGRTGRAYVVDATDHLVAHPNLSLVHSNVDLSAFPQVVAARKLFRDGAARVMSVRGRSPAGEEDVLTSAFSLPSLGWIVFVEQPVSEVMAPVQASLFRTLGLLLVLLAAGFGASLVIARKLTRPIVALQQGAASIGKGDLSARVHIDSGDEIESLATEFNQMAERMGQSYSELESRVAARTRDLADASAALRTQSQEVESLNDQLRERLTELESRKEEAERANAAKTRFLASASHDLRQPMHTVSLLVGILRERMRAPEHASLVDKVQLSVQAMENLFKSLLDISKLDAGAIRPSIGDCAIDGLLRQIEANYAPQAQEKRLVLRVVPSRTVVKSDPVLLERILGNLVSNAIRYTARGKVLVGCRRHGERLRILVIDTGVGIPARHLDDIFEEFVQLANPERDRGKGLGLGLSIVKRSVELLGHTLIVRSRPGMGSTFGVEVPLLRRQPGLPALAAAPAAEPGGDLGSAFVVVIDDDHENRFAMEALCAQWNCHVVGAGSADEALTKLAVHLRTPDLIVTDYRLRDGQTGLMAVERIRRHAEEAIPAVIVTGDIATAESGELSSTGFALLHKPVNPELLRAAMTRLLAAAAGTNVPSGGRNPAEA